MTEGFIPAHGGYQKLLSYQKAETVYDATVYFCDRFIDRRSRTHDQMVQAARSGKQNIIEGSMASGTSKETEIKLTNVARASLEELLADYRDFLRTRGLEEWTKQHPYTKRLRQLNRNPEATFETFRKGIEHTDPAISANVIIGLIRVTNFLLDRQITQLEQAFLKEGGLRERMTRARLESRKKDIRSGDELAGMGVAAHSGRHAAGFRIAKGSPSAPVPKGGMPDMISWSHFSSGRCLGYRIFCSGQIAVSCTSE